MCSTSGNFFPFPPHSKFPPYQERSDPPIPYSAAVVYPLYSQPFSPTSEGVPERPSPKSYGGEGTTLERTPRQLAHVVYEQKRRETINRNFEELRQLIPSSANNPRATILEKASQRIMQLQEENNRLRSHIQSLDLGPLTNDRQSDLCSCCMRHIEESKSPHACSSDMSSASATISGENQIFQFGREGSACSLKGSLPHPSVHPMESEMEIDELASQYEMEILGLSMAKKDLERT
ncbi:hypothetical protein BT69DRAFT_1369014 [Atractiella rhizophila]|nr:hypothetical protein BT69DRAFT_1369014 [Atractiella rhizophila]